MNGGIDMKILKALFKGKPKEENPEMPRTLLRDKFEDMNWVFREKDII